MGNLSMKTILGRVIILVNDYDDAFAFYQKTFMCEKLFDATISENQRFLHIRFSTHDIAGIWLLKAESAQEKELVGKQAGAQPLLVIYTDNCEKLYRNVIENGVTILEEIQTEEGSIYFHFADLYGNRITVVELTES